MAKMTPQGNADRVSRELSLILKNVDGDDLIKAEKVVSWAKQHPNSAIHARFTWDDGEAAHKYRLEQARAVIKVSYVEFKRKYDGKQVHVRQFKSLTTHRGKNGGYMPTVQIMSDADKRNQLLLDTIATLCAIDNIQLFHELDGVRKEIEKVRARYPEKPPLKLAA